MTFEESVRARPAMYFRVGRESPELPTEVLQTVVWGALHLDDGTHRRISVEIESDLSFTVEDDQHHVADEQGRPLAGFYGSLLDGRRWAPAAAAALSVRTTIEVWLDGRGYRQELTGTTPIDIWQEFAAPEPHGTRVTFDLDPSYCGSGEAIAWGLLPRELHGGACAPHSLLTLFPIRDLRPETEGLS